LFCIIVIGEQGYVATSLDDVCVFFFFIGELQGGALLYWRLDAKRHHLLPSSKPCGHRSSAAVHRVCYHWLCIML